MINPVGIFKKNFIVGFFREEFSDQSDILFYICKRPVCTKHNIAVVAQITKPNSQQLQITFLLFIKFAVNMPCHQAGQIRRHIFIFLQNRRCIHDPRIPKMAHNELNIRMSYCRLIQCQGMAIFQIGVWARRCPHMDRHRFPVLFRQLVYRLKHWIRNINRAVSRVKLYPYTIFSFQMPLNQRKHLSYSFP